MRSFLLLGIAVLFALITIGCDNSGVKVIKKDVDTVVDDDLIVWVDEAGDDDTAGDDTPLEKDEEDIKDDAAERDTVVADDDQTDQSDQTDVSEVSDVSDDAVNDDTTDDQTMADDAAVDDLPDTTDITVDITDNVDIATDTTADEGVVTDSDQSDPTDQSDQSDLDTELPDDDGPYAETLCATLTPPAAGLCTGTTGSNDLLIRGVILGHDQIYRGGEVLVGEAGDIICVGCDCSAEPEYGAATVVECADGVVSPALINAHDHMGWAHRAPLSWGTERFDHRHDWRTGARDHTELSVSGGATAVQKQWGELRNVMAGSTVIAGSGGADGFLRNVDQSFFDPEGMKRADVRYETFPLGDANGTLLSSSCAYPGIDPATVLNNGCYFAHVAEGIDTEARNEFLCLSSSGGGGVDLTASNTAFVHLAGLKAADALILAQRGAGHIWSPRSNISLYGNTAPVTLFKTLGVLTGIGTDWTPSGSINILRELKCADHLNSVYYDGFFTSRDLWRMATINNATAFRIAEVTGSLQVGKVADIAIFDGTGYDDDPYQAVIDANVDTVTLTLRGGLPLYGDTDIMAVVPGGQTGCEALGDICGAAKSACIQRESGMSWAAFVTQNATSYPLFFCDTPTNEPTCDPLRTVDDDTRPYGGPTGTDIDGDGIANGSDNCPTLFNPIRPVDNGIQADADSDGVGDLCDPTPLGGVSTINPNDKDGDGITNSSDNCPYDANTDQLDNDLDGAGNICDPCPDTANPMFGSCGIIPIYDLKDGTILPDSMVETSGVVTALDGTSFFLQVPEADQDLTLGYTFSGIYVFSSLTAPAVGDIVKVSGTLVLYFGLLELADVSEIAVVSSGNDLPTPVLIADPADIATGGESADDYNGVLITVEDVTVSNVSLGYGEFAVDGGLRIDDTLYTYTMPTVGDDYDSITGILHYTYDDSKLEPRDAADMVKTLVACGSDTCEEWEECNVDTCVLAAGRCADDGDCTEPTPTCNLTTHYCETDGLSILNGDFELWTNGTTPDSWTADSGVGVAKETTTKHGGSASVKLTRNTTTNGDTDFVSDFVAITENTAYTITFYYYDNDVNGRATLYYSFYNASKVMIGSTVYTNKFTTDQADWQTITASPTSPASAAYITLGTRVYQQTGGTATGGFVYLDDVTITVP
ncbi:MAG TPA: thrombospondin type 3 repeat-containing protein [bacterium]|nr:thrombospondin type 3 repeat-containing protein [bacterium]